jgi:hypothetical protein
LNQNHHDRDHQEDMNESAHGVGADKTEKPKDNQDNGNRVEHLYFSLFPLPRERVGIEGGIEEPTGGLGRDTAHQPAILNLRF